MLDSLNNSTTLLDEVACIKDPDGFPMPDGCYYSEDIPTLLACSLVHFVVAMQNAGQDDTDPTMIVKQSGPCHCMMNNSKGRRADIAQAPHSLQ